MAPLYPHLINKRNSFCKEYLRAHLKFFSWFVANSAFLLLIGILHQRVAIGDQHILRVCCTLIWSNFLQIVSWASVHGQRCQLLPLKPFANWSCVPKENAWKLYTRLFVNLKPCHSGGHHSCRCDKLQAATSWFRVLVCFSGQFLMHELLGFTELHWRFLKKRGNSKNPNLRFISKPRTGQHWLWEA